MGPGQGQEHQRPDLPMYERSSEEQQRPGVMPAGRAHGEWSVSSGNTSHGRMCRKGTCSSTREQWPPSSRKPWPLGPLQPPRVTHLPRRSSGGNTLPPQCQAGPGSRASTRGQQEEGCGMRGIRETARERLLESYTAFPEKGPTNSQDA